MLTPNSTESAESCGPATVTVTELEEAGVAFFDVDTPKYIVPVREGASAVKSTSTFCPALRLQWLDNSILTAAGVALPTPPAPAVPAWMHEPPTMSTLAGTEAKAVEGVTVTESWPRQTKRREGRK